MSLPHFRDRKTVTTPSILDGYKEPRWCLRSFQSVFHFVFGKYRELMHGVDRELREREVLDGGISRGDNTRVCQFLWVVSRDATGYLTLEDIFMRDIDQHGLLIESSLKPIYEPWTRVTYFWDGERMAKIYVNQRQV